MTQTDYTTRVLHADQGHFLTQRAEVAIADRAVTDTVYLAATDSPGNWREITAGEAGGDTRRPARGRPRCGPRGCETDDRRPGGGQ